MRTVFSDDVMVAVPNKNRIVTKLALQAALWYNRPVNMVVVWGVGSTTRPRYKIGACTMSDILSRRPKVCAKCGQTFPKTMMLDGKKVYLHTREHCLDCSPRGTHHLHKSSNLDNRNTCQTCGKEYIGGHGQRKDMCHSCAGVMGRRNKKLQVIEYLGGKCYMCGYNRCPIVLQCHHVDREEKEFNISRRAVKWETLVKELDKCMLLCANCHFEQHAILSQNAPSSHGCNVCGKDRVLRKSGMCQSCAVVRSRRKLKLRVVEYMGGECAVCHYSKYIWALHCHHTGESKKEFVISSRTLKWEKLVQEIDKCVLLCANCHGEYHAGLLDLSSTVPGSLEVKRAAVYRHGRMFESSLGNRI